MTRLLKNSFLLLLLGCAKMASAQTAADGMQAMQLENWDKAVAIYSNLTKANPADQESWLALSNVYLAKNNKDEAKKALDAAFNAKSEGALAWVATGRILMLQGNQVEADKQFARAAKDGRKSSAILRQVGESFVFFKPNGSEKPNFTRALDYLKNAYEVNSKDFQTLMSLAYTYKEKPDGGLAAQHYEFAAALQPQNPLPVYMLAKVYQSAKLPEKALDYFNRTLAIDYSFTPALRDKALYFYFAHKWEAARDAYKDLVSNGKEVTIEDEMQLANTLFITKDYKGTITQVEKIIQKDPSRNYLRRLAGYSYYETQDFSNGLNIMNDYFKAVPAEKIIARDYEYLGRLQVKTKGDTVVALGNLQKSIDMDSSTWPLYKDMAELRYTRKDFCGAGASYQMYLDSVTKKDPNDYYKMGLAWFYCKGDNQNFVKAEIAFAKITELNPNAGVGWFWRGRAASKLEPEVKDDSTAAIFGLAHPYFEKYVELGKVDETKNKKDLITAYSYLVYYHYIKGDGTGFQDNIDNLLRLDPTNETGLGLKQEVEKNGLPTPMAPAKPKTVAPPANPDGGGKGKGKG